MFIKLYGQLQMFVITFYLIKNFREFEGELKLLMEFRHNNKVQNNGLGRTLISCFFSKVELVVFNMQWRCLKEFMIVLRAVEIHQMHRNMFNAIRLVLL